MKILIVNDDSLSKGLEMLVRVASRYGLCYVSIPVKQMSATSQAISIKSKISFEKPHKLISGAEDMILVHGTPSDATRVGMKHYDIDFDLVISGLNFGPNLGTDIIYSGTVAAAREAAIFGTPAIAISCYHFNLEGLENNLDLLINYIIENKIYEKCNLLNINFPNSEKPKGYKFTFQGNRIRRPELVKLSNNEFKLLDSIINYEEQEGSDVYYDDRSYITITPLKIDQSEYKKIKEFQK